MSVSDQATRAGALEATISRHHGVTFADVLETISYLRDPGDSVIVGGSLALGLGNRLSDLDIVVSGDAAAESSRVPIEHWVKTLRVDVWKLAKPAMDELVGRAERVLDGDAPVDGAFGDVFEEADLKLLHRVAFGIALDGPPLRPAATRGYAEIAGDLLVREYAERARESAFVAQLALAAGDGLGASFNARLVAHSALFATLAARGVPFTGDKWLRDRLEQDMPDLAALHERFLVLPDEDGDAGDFVDAALDAGRRLLGIDLSLDALAPQASFDAGDLRLYEAGPERYLISAERDLVYALDGAEVAAWQSLGDAGDESARRLAFSLYRVGAVKLRWARGLPLGELSLDRVTA